MKAFLNWLSELFRVEAVWLDKGQGRWVRRYRFHPVTKAFLLLLLGGVAGYVFFMSDMANPPQETPEAQQPVAEKPDETQQLVSPPTVAHEKGPDTVSSDLTPLVSSLDLVGLGVAEEERWVRIVKGTYKLYLYRGVEVEKTYDIAIAKNSGNKERRGDNRTPTGSFVVQSIENSSSWTHDFRDGNGVIKGAYGPWFIRLKTGWQGIGIHGTHAPESIGTMASEGCIRMNNDELEDLKKIAFKDMRVVIEE